MLCRNATLYQGQAPGAVPRAPLFLEGANDEEMQTRKLAARVPVNVARDPCKIHRLEISTEEAAAAFPASHFARDARAHQDKRNYYALDLRRPTLVLRL